MNSDPGSPGELAALLVRPLEDQPEARVFVSGDFAERLGAYSPRQELLISEAADRLRDRQPRVFQRFPRLLRVTVGVILLWLLSIVALLWPLALSFSSPYQPPYGSRGRGLPRKAPAWETLPQDVVTRWAAARQTPESIIDFKSPSATEAIDQAYTTWRRHGQDPVYYYFYCQLRIENGRGLPADFDATWRRIDPLNAVWPMLQAEALCVDAVSGFSYRDYAIHDTLMFSNAVDSLTEAAKLPHMDDFRGAHPALVHASFPPPRISAEVRYIQSYERYYHDGSPAQIELVLEAERRERVGDSASLEAFLKVAQACFLHQMLAGKTYVYNTLDEPLQRLADVADSAGLEEDSERFLTLKMLATSPVAEQTYEKPRLSARDWFRFWGGLPWQNMDRLPVTWAFLFASGLLLVIVTLFLWLRAWPSRRISSLSSWCAEELLDSRWLARRWWLAAVVPGFAFVAAPFAWESGVQGFYLPLLLIFLCAIAQATRLEVQRTAGLLQVNSSTASRRIGLGWVLLGLAVFSVVGPRELRIWAGITAWGWLLFGFLFAFARRSRTLAHRLMARLALPLVLCALAAICLMSLGFQVLDAVATHRAGAQVWEKPMYQQMPPETIARLEALKAEWTRRE